MISIKVDIPDGEKVDQSIDKTSFTIGRSKEADIVLKIEGMSRKHLQVDIDGDQIYITDLNSSNGVFINEEKIEPGKKVPYHTFLPLTVCAGISIQLEFK